MSKIKILKSLIQRIIKEEKFKSSSPIGSIKEVERLKSEIAKESDAIRKLKFEKSQAQWKLDNLQDEYMNVMADMEQDPEFDVDSGQGSSFGSKNYHGRKLKQYQDKESKYSNQIGYLDAEIAKKMTTIEDLKRRLGNFPEIKGTNKPAGNIRGRRISKFGNRK